MRLELLANLRSDLAHDEETLSPDRWSWRDRSGQARGEVTGRGAQAACDALTRERERFLVEEALEISAQGRQGFIRHLGRGKARMPQGPARVLDCGREVRAFRAAGLDAPLADPGVLPRGSVCVRLGLDLLSPLFSRDDDPFNLFDNPLRKDPIFGRPHLSANALGGQAADAFRRAFPAPAEGQDEPARTLAYRRAQARARRLFGLADDTDPRACEGGRLRWSPLWLDAVQYVVMNPIDRDRGIGTQPIHFEAAAPQEGRWVECLYLNPYGARESDPALARADMAALLGALAAWWPLLGLGAKRRAGYGALRSCRSEVWVSGAGSGTFQGEDAWRQAAHWLAAGEGGR